MIDFMSISIGHHAKRWLCGLQRSQEVVSKPQITPKDPPEADERAFLRELGCTFSKLKSMLNQAMRDNAVFGR
jgi:hypothetical protein